MSLADRHLSHRLAAKYGTGGRLGWQSAAIKSRSNPWIRLIQIYYTMFILL